MVRRALPRIAEMQASLGLPTIMDLALAAAHGVRYVHLAVFAIDIDRTYWLDPERSDLPFGWEVFVTEHYLLEHVDPSDPAQRELLEAACLDLMDESPGEPPLGGQLTFAVYDAVQRKQLPEALGNLFSRWRSPPRELLQSLTALWAARDASLAQIAKACLAADLTPPLAPPTRHALEAMVGSKTGS